MPELLPVDATDPTLPTGGLPSARIDGRRWVAAVTPFLGRGDTAAGTGAPPQVAVVGADREVWSRVLATVGRLVEDEGRMVDRLLLVDALAAADADVAAALVRDAVDRCRPGAHLLVVDRVVHPSGSTGMDVDELLATLFLAAGGAVTLAEVVSLSRPGERTRTSVLLDLVVLGAGRSEQR